MGEEGLIKKEPMEELCKDNEGESLTLSVVGDHWVVNVPTGGLAMEYSC